MIFNQTVLEEKAQESEEKIWDYLLDNAENDNEVALIENMQEILEVFKEDEFYFIMRDEALSFLNITL